MARKYVFADESGNFDFSRSASASRYFILVTLTLPDCSLGQEVLDLRRQLAWEGHGLETEFHATEDRQAVRDRMFALLATRDFRIDATILEKSKAKPTIRATDERFYQQETTFGVPKRGFGRCSSGAANGALPGGVVVRCQRPVPPGCRLLRVGSAT